MERLTRISDHNDTYVTDETMIRHEIDTYSGEAITKLATFENIYEDLITKQSEISGELEKLRNAGKTKSVRFKELLVNKMTNAAIIDLFNRYGVK